jgi:hypothetical protein
MVFLLYFAIALFPVAWLVLPVEHKRQEMTSWKLALIPWAWDDE